MKATINDLNTSNPDILVPGLGYYPRKALRQLVSSKLADLTERLSEDRCSTIGEPQFDVLSAMYLALGTKDAS